MRLLKVSAVMALAVSAAACHDSEFATPLEPGGGVRFINAVPDTGAMTMRFVDIVENSSFWNVAFRSSAVFYQRAKAGQRQLRIFMHGTTAEVASTVVKDTVITIEDGKNYSVIVYDNARPSGPKLMVMQDDPPAPGAGQVGLRAINLAPSLGPVDVFLSAQGSSVPLPGTPTFSSVPVAGSSAYTTAAAATYQFRVTAPASITVLGSHNAVAGSATTVGSTSFAPGTNIAGSVVGVYIFPRSVAGSQAPQTLTTPGMLSFWERRP